MGGWAWPHFPKLFSTFQLCISLFSNVFLKYIEAAVENYFAIFSQASGTRSLLCLCESPLQVNRSHGDVCAQPHCLLHHVHTPPGEGKSHRFTWHIPMLHRRFLWGRNKEKNKWHPVCLSRVMTVLLLPSRDVWSHLRFCGWVKILPLQRLKAVFLQSCSRHSPCWWLRVMLPPAWKMCQRSVCSWEFPLPSVQVPGPQPMGTQLEQEGLNG